MADKKIIAIEIKVTDRNASKVIKTTTKSGLNNAILIETGRVASDAAYGMQGIANNLGRLLELGQEFARTGKGGFLGAFKELGKSLLGFGGVIVGVQLLLSYAPKLIKMFRDWAGQVTRVTEALQESTEVYGEQIGRLETYTKMLNSSTVSSEQKAIILNATMVAAGGGLAGVSALISGSSENRRKELDDTAKQIELLQKKLEELGIFPDDEKKKGSARIRAFKQQLLDLAKLEERYRQQSELTFILNEEESKRRGI